MTKTLGNYRGNDVELCATTSGRIGEKTARVLIENHVSFTKNKKHIPFYKRDEFKGAKTVWIISISPRQYSKARRVIDQMDLFYRQRLLLSNY